jgi:HAD superfamily hydrolase (TIGR01509 family)
VLRKRVALRAVLFDLDGTLVDSERQYSEAMAIALARDAGIEVTAADRAYGIGRSWVAIHEHLRGRFPDLPWTRDELIARTAAESKALFAVRGVDVMPGALAAVARFRDRRRALVTGSSRAEASHMLGFLAIADAFEVTLCAEDVVRSKPAPDGYLAACARLGVAPREALVIEDSTAGCTAGRAAGCAVIAVRAGNFAGQDQSCAHRIVDTLDEITIELADAVAEAAARGYGDEPLR